MLNVEIGMPGQTEAGLNWGQKRFTALAVADIDLLESLKQIQIIVVKGLQ